MSETDIDAILRGGKSRRGWLLLAGAAVVVAAVVIAVFLLTRAGETDVVFEPERTEAVMGQLTTEVDLSGSALSERSATLSFEVAGVVASLEVSRGDEVRQGDSLASLDDTEAQRRVETAQIQLGLAQLRLEDLLAGPEPSAIASANQALASANSQVIGAEQALALLSEPPSASDLASAEQAVASALREVSSAQQALTLLSEPPSASDLRSAEQAVATALREISNSEQALNDLTTDPSEAVVSEARSAVTQAQVQLADATRLEEELNEILTTAAEDFCERYSGLIPSDEVIRSIRTAILPLSDTEVDALQDSFEDRSATYESLGLAFIEANLTFVAAAADRDSALSTLRSSEETLAELLKPVSEDDLYQAQQAVEAARASHAAAVARLEDLQTLAGEDDVYQGSRRWRRPGPATLQQSPGLGNCRQRRAKMTCTRRSRRWRRPKPAIPQQSPGLRNCARPQTRGNSSRPAPRWKVPGQASPAPRPSTMSLWRDLQKTPSSSSDRICAWPSSPWRKLARPWTICP